MRRSVLVRRLTIGAALAYLAAGCEGTQSTQPISSFDKSAPELRHAWAIGSAAPYSGVLTPGVFVVCTSLIAAPGTYTYAVESDRSIEKSVRMVSMQPGECRVVSEAKKNPDKMANHSVTVTALTSNEADGLVVIDGDCSVSCARPGFPTSVVLAGAAGAVAKFYFAREGFGFSGGHGGVGTISFAQD